MRKEEREMKIAVIYRSMTGHSRKIARAVAAELGVEAKDVKKSPSIKSVDLLLVVGGIYSGKSLPEMTDFLSSLDHSGVKKAVLITSSLSRKVGQDGVRAILSGKGIAVDTEELHLIGNFLFLKMGHPNKREIAEAVDFARKKAGDGTCA